MASDAPELQYSLPPAAYEPTPEGSTYPPVVPDETNLPELTVMAVLVGVHVGVIFGAANAYLGLTSPASSRPPRPT